MKSDSSNPANRRSSHKLPGIYLNYVSMVGGIIILVNIFIFLLTLFLDLSAQVSPAYLGILYLLYLSFIMGGVAMIPLGILLERRRRAKAIRRGLDPGDSVSNLMRFWRVRQRLVLIIGGSGLALVILVVPLFSYQTYNATESNDFCGKLCHTVMTPEYTTYQYSSHARVKCVECHIGSGAGWYVKSKLSGIRQVLAVALNTYPKPVPTPIKDLRPARETCEECHWPKKFIGYKEMVRTYFHSNEENTSHKIRMLMKIGGEENSLMGGSGIHYHMLLANKVEYIARDNARQEIPWVRITHNNLTEEVFENQDIPLTEAEKETLEVRTMDCMDCHNRPSHQFPSPMHAVNKAMSSETISLDLPKIKLVSVQALSQEYAGTEQAMLGIEAFVQDYYKENYPEEAENQEYSLAKSVAGLQEIYRQTIFPEMKAKWSAYPDNIGHRDWPGCFRCHNENMVSEKGNAIFTTCNKCHLILAQGENIERIEVNINEGLPFIHPDEEEELNEFTECIECHTGGGDLYD